MAKVTPAEFAEKWQRRLSQSQNDIQRGVNRVTVAPTEKAASKKDKMLANLTAAVNSGKWEAGLMRVSLSDWKKATIEKGLPRLQAGVQAAQPKVQQFAVELLAHIDSVQGELQNMPDLTLEDNIQRMVHNVRRMSEFKRS